MGEHLGFVGLGRMGARMASRLLDAGHTLTVFDVSEAALKPLEARGARRAASAKAVADEAEVVFASLPSLAILRDAALGPNGVICGRRIKTFIDLSTSGPGVSGIVYRGLAEKGIVALDAPVSGGVKGAADGTLAIMVGGPKASFDQLQPILAVFGKLFFMGETPGSGQTMKLVNNLISCATIAVTAEGMAMGERAGLDAKLMIDVLNVSTGASSATRDKWPRSVLPRTFDYGFATALAFKDVRLCLEEAEAMGVPMVVGSAARQFLSITNQLYGPDSDFTCMAKTAEVLAAIDTDKPAKKQSTK
jgi:3-hydroxyisobutyrate dehydrogenase-like beta-hydroxyacid dehydrogenase